MDTWDDAGFDPDEAAAWEREGFGPNDAALWRERYDDPAEARRDRNAGYLSPWDVEVTFEIEFTSKKRKR